MKSLKYSMNLQNHYLTWGFESPRYDPGLQCNPGHVVIIFTRVAIMNGARRYDSKTWPRRLALSVSEPKRKWIGHSAGEFPDLHYNQVLMSPMLFSPGLFSHWKFLPKGENSLVFSFFCTVVTWDKTLKL